MKSKGALTVGIIGIASLGLAGCCGCDVELNTEYRDKFTEVSFEEMTDDEYMVGQLVKYEGGICYDGGWPGVIDADSTLAILFEDDASGEAFFAESITMKTWENVARTNTALGAVNCDEDFITYGRKSVNDQGNPVLEVSDLEFKMGAYRTEILHFRDLSPDS